MGLFDLYAPNSAGYITSDQQSAASNLGLMQAGLNMINASQNHYGLPTSNLAVLAQGVGGYGQGVNEYINSIPNASGSALKSAQNNLALQQDQLRQQLAQAYLTGNKAIGATNPQSAPLLPVRSQPLQPISGFGASIPSMNASDFSKPIAPGVPNPPTPMQLGGMSQQAPSMDDNSPMTSMGMTVKQLASFYNDQANMHSAMGDDAGATQLREAAVKIDPAIVYSTASQQAAGQLPSELTKIGATGAQTRQTEGYKAGITPYQQTVMVNGVPTTISTNNLAASTGEIPQNTLAGFYQSDKPTNISTSVPESAKTAAAEQGKDFAEAQQASGLFDSRMSNALSMIQQMKDLAAKTYSGYTGELGNLISRETGGGKRNEAQQKFEQLNSNLFTQELPGIIKGAGGRLDIPLLNAIKQASAIDPYDPPATKQAALDNLQKILVKAQQNAQNQVTNMSAQSGMQSKANPTAIQTFSSPSDPAFKSLPSGAQFMDQDGNLRIKH